MKPKGAAVAPPEYLSVTGGAPLRSPLRSPHPIFQRFSNVRFSEDDLAPLAAVASFQGSYKASTSVNKQSCEPSTSVKLSYTINPVRNYLPPGKEPFFGIKTFSRQKTGYFAEKDYIFKPFFFHDFSPFPECIIGLESWSEIFTRIMGPGKCRYIPGIYMKHYEARYI